jgi:hypothetical protein
MALSSIAKAMNPARIAGVLACLFCAVLLAFASDLPAVHLDTSQPVGPRTLEKETQTSVVRDYLESWQSMDRALAENRADLLDRFFIGEAKQKLASTITEQQKLGVKVRYRDRSHNLKIVFYSPEGLSIQLVDTVEYDLEFLDSNHTPVTQPMRSRYVAVLSPAERRWQVRIFQAVPDSLGFAVPAAQLAVKGRQ